MATRSGAEAGVATLPDRWVSRVVEAGEKCAGPDAADALQTALLAQRRADDNDEAVLTAARFLDPCELLELVRAAAAETPGVTVESSLGQPADDDAELPPGPYRTSDDYRRLVRRLADQTYIAGEYIDRLTGLSRYVEYHLDYVAPEPVHQEGVGGEALAVTLLRRDAKPVVLSYTRVAYESQGSDAYAAEHETARWERTVLVDDDDPLGECILGLASEGPPRQPR